MGVDVAELAGGEPCPIERLAHRSNRAFAVLRRMRDVIGVRGGGVTGEFRDDCRAARLCVFQVFQHEDARALTHHKAIAVCVERAGCPGGIVIALRGERARLAETGECDGGDRGLSTTGERGRGIATSDEVRRRADRIGAGAAGRRDGIGGARARPLRWTPLPRPSP